MTQPDPNYYQQPPPPPQPQYNYGYVQQPQQQAAGYSNSTTMIPNPFPWWAHLIHVTATIFTCGLWGIAWAIHYAVWPKTKLVRTTTHWQPPTHQ